MQASKVGVNIRLTLGMGKVGSNLKFFGSIMWKRHGKETKSKKCIMHTHKTQIQQKQKTNVGLDFWIESSKSLKLKLSWISRNMKHNACFCQTTFSKL